VPGIARLDAIATGKRHEVRAAQAVLPLDALAARARNEPPARGFLTALRGDGIAVIGEVKRASPAAGPIRDDVDAAALARRFVAGGAAALAAWTDRRHFNGDLDLLRTMRAAVAVPVLRKDFIVDPYQVFESRAGGADAVMLIAAILDAHTLRDLLGLCDELAMAAPVSVHREVDVDTAIEAGARAVFIHNRDVETFETDLAVTRRFRPRIPPGVLVVSESGIGVPADVTGLRGYVDAVLVGTGLMTSDEPEAVVRSLREAGAGARSHA
jgi:indole-3-glycerol phosphate synthase